jgi:hypothetical protein
MQFLESQNDKYWNNLRKVRRCQNGKFETLLEQQVARDIIHLL